VNLIYDKLKANKFLACEVFPESGYSFAGCGQLFPSGIRRGRRSAQDDDEKPSSIALVTNGRPANIESYPWHASLSYISGRQKSEDVCGGSLISPRVVLTGIDYFIWDGNV